MKRRAYTHTRYKGIAFFTGGGVGGVMTFVVDPGWMMFLETFAYLTQGWGGWGGGE